MEEQLPHKFEDDQKVRIIETGEIVTIDHWWFASNGPLSKEAQYNVKEKSGTWFAEHELEPLPTIKQGGSVGIIHQNKGIIQYMPTSVVTKNT